MSIREPIIYMSGYIRMDVCVDNSSTSIVRSRGLQRKHSGRSVFTAGTPIVTRLELVVFKNGPLYKEKEVACGYKYVLSPHPRPVPDIHGL